MQTKYIDFLNKCTNICYIDLKLMNLNKSLNQNICGRAPGIITHFKILNKF